MPNFDDQNLEFIGTHNGKFHCDEVFACWMLKKLPEFKGCQILRTRDPEFLERCKVVVDVGGKFNHEAKRYDHHQKDFNETMRTLSIQLENGKLTCSRSLDFDTRLSAAGLIYAFYGKKVLQIVLQEQESTKMEDDDIDLYYNRLYKHFVEAVDAVDNGIKQYEGEPKYLTPVSLQSLVEELNPAWSDRNANEDVQFEKAMKVVGDIFERQVYYMHHIWMPCRTLVHKAINGREKFHKSGKIVVLPLCPWKQHLFSLEQELQVTNKMIYAIYPGDKNKTDWRVQAIPVTDKSDFDNRCPLPESWRGLRDGELASETDVKSATFVHATGFIGGAEKLEDAILMAEKSLEIAKLI